MSGIIVPLFPKKSFDFTFLGVSAFKTITIHRALNVVPFYYAKLIVRVHNVSIVAAGTQGTIKVIATGTDPSREDPQEFVDPAAAVLTITLNNASTAPSYQGISDSNLAPYYKITLLAQQGSTAGGALYAEISADLVLREA